MQIVPYMTTEEVEQSTIAQLEVWLSKTGPQATSTPPGTDEDDFDDDEDEEDEDEDDLDATE